MVDTDFIAQINAQTVPASLLGEVMIMWASLSPEEWRDFDRRLQRVVDFVEKKSKGAASPMVAMAVALRLMALDTMVGDPEIRGWLMPGPSSTGITYVHGDLLKIAAEQTLLEGPAGEPIFDRAAFRARLMEVTAARGRA